MFQNIFLVFFKEVRYIYKDKIYLFANYILPFMVAPIVLIYMGESLSLVQSFTKNKLNSEKENITYYINHGYTGGIKGHLKEKGIKVLDLPSDIDRLLSDYLDINNKNHSINACNLSFRAKLAQMKLLETRNSDKSYYLSHLKKVFEKRNIQFVLYFDQNIGQYGNSSYYFFYNEKGFLKSKRNKVMNILNDIRIDIAVERLKFINEDIRILEPFKKKKSVELINIKEDISILISKGIPFFLVYMLLFSILAPAIFAFIKEKEHNTLSTLYMTGATETEIVLGKIFAVNFLAISATFVYGITGYLILFMAGSKFSIALDILSPYILLILFFSMTLMTTIISLISLNILAFAKNANQAQSMISTIILFVIFPVLIFSQIDIKLSVYSSMVPFFNLMILLKALWLEEIRLLYLIIILLLNVLVMIPLFLTGKKTFFNDFNSSISDGDIDEILSTKNIRLKRITPAVSVVTFVGIFLLLAYFSVFFGGLNFEFITVITQSIILIFSIGILFHFGIRIKNVINLENIKILNLLFVAIIILSLQFILQYSLPILFNKFSFLNFNSYSIKDINFLYLVIFLCLLPSIGEEIAFRGIILKGILNKFGKYFSIIISSLLFAIIHFSIFRLFPTLLLGILLGIIFLKTHSIFTSMFAHFLYNFCGILIYKFDVVASYPVTFNTYLLISIILVSIIVVMLFLIKKQTKILNKTSRVHLSV